MLALGRTWRWQKLRLVSNRVARLENIMWGLPPLERMVDGFGRTWEINPRRRPGQVDICYL